jgi:hypothetical protein
MTIARERAVCASKIRPMAVAGQFYPVTRVNCRAKLRFARQRTTDFGTYPQKALSRLTPVIATPAPWPRPPLPPCAGPGVA